MMLLNTFLLLDHLAGSIFNVDQQQKLVGIDKNTTSDDQTGDNSSYCDTFKPYIQTKPCQKEASR